MQIRSLEHFVTLAQAGSFYQAGKHSDISVQGYAKVLDSLERELGMTLAVRSKTGVRLTPAGEIFLEYAKQVVEGLIATLDRIEAASRERDEETERIAIYTTHYGMQIIARLDYLYASVPGYDLYEEPFDKILARSKSARPNEIFFADIFTDDAVAEMNSQNIAFEPFFESALGVIVREDCPLAQQDAVSLADIGTLKLSNYHHRERIRFVDSVLGERASGSVSFESTALNLLVDYIKASPDRGILDDTLSAYSVRKSGLYDLSGLRFVPLKDGAARIRLGVLYCRNRPQSPEVSSIIGLQRGRMRLHSADYFDKLEAIGAQAAGGQAALA